MLIVFTYGSGTFDIESSSFTATELIPIAPFIN
jgi:hypothetical protein